MPLVPGWQSPSSGGIPCENRAKFDPRLIGNVVPSSCLAGQALKCTGEYRGHRWPKTHETMRCASGKVGAPAADETETLKQSFAEWKKFRPVREFPSSEQLGASLWKVWSEKGEEQRRQGRWCSNAHTSSEQRRSLSPPDEATSLASVGRRALKQFRGLIVHCTEIEEQNQRIS